MPAHELLERVRTQGASTLSGGELLAALDALGDERRALDALGVELTGALDALGPTAEYRTTMDAVAIRTGVPVDEARIWCLVGAATVRQVSLQGEILPPRCEAVAAAVREGVLGIADAALVVRTLDRLVPFTDAARRGAVERAMVEAGPHVTRRELAMIAQRAIDHIDPDGAEPREDLLRAQAGLRVRRTPDGIVRWVITMHPEAEGILNAAIDARTAPRRVPSFALVGAEVEDDPRTMPQRRLDALIDMGRESLQHDRGQVAGAPVTMLVTVSLDALLTGIGTAQVAGVDLPISATTARRLASDAEVIPVVLGGKSEILDEGRACRLFTTAQRRAMVVRDGGCVWPGCNAPPGWCEAAHLRSWLDGGPTDLSNGASYKYARFELRDYQPMSLETSCRATATRSDHASTLSDGGTDCSS